jgi:hypothetical protein
MGSRLRDLDPTVQQTARVPTPYAVPSTLRTVDELIAHLSHSRRILELVGTLRNCFCQQAGNHKSRRDSNFLQSSRWRSTRCGAFRLELKSILAWACRSLHGTCGRASRGAARPDSRRGFRHISGRSGDNPKKRTNCSMGAGDILFCSPRSESISTGLRLL